jgi:beta-glucanase (GH16 family)
MQVMLFFRWTFVALSACLLLGGGCGNAGSEAGGAVGEPLSARWPANPDWVKVWGDEFEQEGLPDSTKWAYETGGHGWGNEERQYYTEARPENARVENGHLLISAREETFRNREYTSARLNSESSWTYGRFEIRAQVPEGRGTWPALWLLASQDTYGDQFWPDNGEIDIMEHVGHEPNVIHSTVHTEAFNHIEGTQRGASVEVPTATSSFHVYTLEWTPNKIRSFVDGDPYFTFRKSSQAGYAKWPFNHDSHLILNVAVGGTWGGAEGVADGIWPAQLKIDYVRVYKPESQLE